MRCCCGVHKDGIVADVAVVMLERVWRALLLWCATRGRGGYCGCGVQKDGIVALW